MLMSSGRAIPSSIKTACSGVSRLTAATSRRSAFASASCESEMSTFGSLSGWTIATALRGGVLSSIADSTPTPNRMRKPNNTILSMMRFYPELVLVKILRSNEAICRRLPTTYGSFVDRVNVGDAPDAPALVEVSFWPITADGDVRL